MHSKCETASGLKLKEKVARDFTASIFSVNQLHKGLWDRNRKRWKNYSCSCQLQSRRSETVHKIIPVVCAFIYRQDPYSMNMYDTYVTRPEAELYHRLLH